ncbi:hypothetical protein BDZ45DRAFT_13223 [Acephala macrosclerotiorum]|nr:hypothetical protein BDZ45DRAFT_13223 [Acephala macrosclerotiorum]
MSFGYSVGDFIAALDLTIKLYNAFKSAPNEFAEISRELESFSVVLSSLRDQAGDPGSVLNRNVTAKRSELMVLCDNLVTTMQELQELYQRYEKMGRSKVSWLRRVRLGMEDLHSLRSKLTFHMSAISAFVANLNTATLARMEPMLERIWNILDEQMKCGAAKAQTILSISTKSESVGAAWAMLKMNLRTEGIPLDYIEQNAESIIEVAVAAAELNVIVDGSDGGTVLPDDSISQVGVGKTEIQQAKDSRENNTIARDEEPIQISQLEVQNHQGEGKRSISLELKPTSGSSSSAITQSLEASLSSELSSSFMSMSPPSSTSKSPLREYVGKWKSSAGAQSQRLLDALGGNPQEGLYPSVKSTRLVIAIEYGVEFTAVAFAFPRRMNNASFDDISVVEDWGPQMKLSSKIPSAISYSPAISPLDQQWGASLSEDALVITNTKLELENSGSKEGLLGSISRLLEGTSNLAFEYIKTSKGIDNYPWKSPEEIVTDYLTHVFQYLMASFEFLNPRLLSKISTDIVISVPAQWTYHGHNSLFRAVTNSGFNKSSFPSLADLIMVAEGDALAMGALREVQERFGHNSFKDDEFIMLCECGNDTTEVTIYKVKSLSGTLQLELITEAKSTQCGYKDVNQNFQKWLRKVIGDHKYRVLVPKAVGRYSSSDGNWSLSMRRVMNRFEDQKKAFSYGRGFNYSIELPNRLWRHDRVQDGTLTISNEAMRTFFDPWITAALRLIEQQLGEFENSGGTITKILLVEDCNRSGTPYLQEAARTALSSAEVIFSSGAKCFCARFRYVRRRENSPPQPMRRRILFSKLWHVSSVIR